MRLSEEAEFTQINEQYDRMPYAEQIKAKQNYALDIFAKNKINITLDKILINPKPLNYRHKVIVSATNSRATGRNRIRLGLYKEGTKTIVPGVANHLHDKDINEVLLTVETILNKYKFEAYSKKYTKGIIKHVLVRKSYLNNTMLLVFVTQGYIFPNHKKVINDIVSKHNQIKTVVQNIHHIDTPIVILSENKILYGPGYIEDGIDQLKFRLSANSFYQVNPAQMNNLYSLALDFAKIQKTDCVMDCYCGIGTISLLAAKSAKEVIAIESNENAFKDAIFNKKNNDIDNAYFYLSNVEDFVYDYDKKIDVLIMDPTRDGASAKFIKAIRQMKPSKIVYISCYLETQVRDILKLQDLYEAKKARAVDMFSYTSHVETITLLSLK